MTPDQYCALKATQSGSSFYYSFRFLTPEKRRAITAVYAFCREVDDTVDEVSDPGVATRKLDWWKSEIALVFSGAPNHPVGKALVPVVRQFGLEKHYFDAIIEGMAMDLAYNRYPDFASLARYCHHVASDVGVIAAKIFGKTSPETLHYAHDLGLALQLTNIIRDVGEDARRNRIYLPLNELQQFGVSEADILASKQTPEFVKLMQFQAERARGLFSQALAQLPKSEQRAQRPGLIMAAIYQRLLHEIEVDHFLVLRQRTSLTIRTKLWLAFRVSCFGL